LVVFFSGRVQGVGFRYAVRQLAEDDPLTGFVKNLPDGRVELQAEGERRILERFLEEVRSRMGGYIRQAEISWETGPARFGDFRILY
jgi:acylphosphatase